MHMHATPCDGTIQKVLIRKSLKVLSGGKQEMRIT